MPSFPMQDPYADESDDVDSSDYSDFDIDSDASDPELLFLKRTLKVFTAEDSEQPARCD